MKVHTLGSWLFATLLLCSLPLTASANQNHFIEIEFTGGSAFGLTSPVKVVGTFDVDPGFLDSADGNYPGSVVKNFRLQVGSQLYDQNTASNPNIQGVNLQGQRITGLAMNFAQGGGPILQMATDGTVFACTSG